MYWGHNIGGHIGDIPMDLDKTSDGVLLTTSTSLESKGLHKYDSNGNLLWQFDFFESLPNGEYSNYNFLKSEVDENDNIYTLLNFQESSTDINGITINNGISLLKIDSNGNLIWSEKISASISGNEINLLYKNNTLFVLGNFLGNPIINNNISLTSQQYWDCYSLIYRYGIDYYIAKFDLTGNLVDAKSFGTEYNDHVVSAAIDNNSNIYFTGGSEFHGGCSTRYTHITKYNENLEFQWEKEISKEENGSQLLYPTNIYYSETSNKLYLWGYNVGEVSNIDYIIPDAASCDGIEVGIPSANILEFNAQDGIFSKHRQYPNCTTNPVWQIGGTVSPIISNKSGIYEHGEKLIILSSICGTMELDNTNVTSTFYTAFGPNNEPLKINDENLFLMWVDKGNFESHLITKFEESPNSQPGVAIDNPGALIGVNHNIYLSASFKASPSLNVLGNNISNNSGNNDSDVLITKINLENVLSTNDESSFVNFNIYPNPANDFIFFKKTNRETLRIKIYSLTGSIIKELELGPENDKLDISELVNGLYLFKLISFNNQVTIKKILINNH
jgi:hypothetical protein